MADSRLFGGRKLAGIELKVAALCQSSFESTTAPVLSYNSNRGLGSALLIPKLLNVGPSALTSTGLFPLPVIIKPPMRTLSPSCANARVEILDRFEGAAPTTTVPLIPTPL